MQIKKCRLFWVLTAIIVLGYLVMPVSAVEKQISEGKAAIVNGTVITQADFDKEVNRAYQQLAGTGRSPNESQMPEFKKWLLEKLISNELLYQESQKKGIKVEDNAVKERVDVLKARFPSEDEFKVALKNMEISETELKDQLRNSIAVQEFVENEFVAKIEVTEKEVKDFYNTNIDSFKEPEQVRASHILIKVAPEADEPTKATARKKLNEVRKKIQNGEDFAALAETYSEGPSSSNGGDLGYFGKGQMVKPFEEVAFALPIGKVSDIVETQFGYHLIKVVDKKPASTKDYKEVKEKLHDYLKQQKVQEKIAAYVEGLKEKAKIERFL